MTQTKESPMYITLVRRGQSLIDRNPLVGFDDANVKFELWNQDVRRWLDTYPADNLFSERWAAIPSWLVENTGDGYENARSWKRHDQGVRLRLVFLIEVGESMISIATPFLTSLTTFVNQGHAMLREGNRPADAHSDFVRWDNEVAAWFDRLYPKTGYSARWSSLNGSPLGKATNSPVDPDEWRHFELSVDERIHFLENVAIPVESGIPDEPAELSSVSLIVPSKIFIGHGGSSAWLELKAFLQERLNLSADEFNRVSVAGVSNVSRLSQMLDVASFAFLVMTAEDEQSDGRHHARANVIHEAGLFQGRLGFEHAIVLLEDGCEQFSNIDGLGQIRFSKGDIAGSFEKVRLALESQEIIDATNT